MSRAASMQVLNDAFRNLNAAFAAYTHNKNIDRRNDLNEEMARLDNAFRKSEAAREQSNLDRIYARNAARDRQEQENWESGRSDARNRESADQKMRNGKILIDILRAAPDEGIANAMATQMGAGWSDPIQQGAFFRDWYKTKKLRDLKEHYDDFLKMSNRLQLAKLNQQHRAFEAQQKFDLEREKLRNSQSENIMKYAVPYMTAAMQNATTESPYDMAKAVEDFNEMKSRLNGTYRQPAQMTPEQALQAYKSGRITKDELAEIRKGF